jgi:hypothetical protein
MAGRRNRRHLEVLQLLRERAAGQDEAIAAWQQSREAVAESDAEIERLRVDFEATLAAARAQRDDAVGRSATLLGVVAVLVGDDAETARLLDVPLGEVRSAMLSQRAKLLGDIHARARR